MHHHNVFENAEKCSISVAILKNGLCGNEDLEELTKRKGRLHDAVVCDLLFMSGSPLQCTDDRATDRYFTALGPIFRN